MNHHTSRGKKASDLLTNWEKKSIYIYIYPKTQVWLICWKKCEEGLSFLKEPSKSIIILCKKISPANEL